MKALLVLLLLMVTGLVSAQSTVSSNEHTQMIIQGSPQQLLAIDKVIAPSVAKARKTYPAAKRRFLAGLPSGQSFFISTRLHDRSENIQQVFIVVEQIKQGRITGRIWESLSTMPDFRKGDRYTFPEAQLLDWLIIRPDGSEEGGYVAKYLDTISPKQ